MITFLKRIFSVILCILANNAVLGQRTKAVEYEAFKLDMPQIFICQLDSLIKNDREKSYAKLEGVYFKVLIEKIDKEENDNFIIFIELEKIPPIPSKYLMGFTEVENYTYFFYGEPIECFFKKTKIKRRFSTKDYDEGVIPIIYDPPRWIFIYDPCSHSICPYD